MPKDEKVHLCALWLTVPYAPVTYVNGGKSVALPSILCVCVAMPLDFQDLSSPTRSLLLLMNKFHPRKINFNVFIC